MRASLDHIQRHRLTKGPLATPSWAMYGTFVFQRESASWYLNISDSRDPGAVGWEHAVLLGLKDKDKLRVIPDIWVIEDFKELVWNDEEPVIMLVNRQFGDGFAAHMWRPPNGKSAWCRPETDWAYAIARKWKVVKLGELEGRTEQLEIA